MPARVQYAGHRRQRELYNESGDSAIWPTPVVGLLGLLEDYRLRIPSASSGGLTDRAYWVDVAEPIVLEQAEQADHGRRPDRESPDSL